MKNKTYEGNIEIKKENQSEWAGKLAHVVKIKGYVFVTGGATLNAPLLAECAEVSVAGTLNAPLLKKERSGVSYVELSSRIIKSLHKKYISKGYILADGILSRIIRKRKAGKIVVWKTSKIGNRKKIVYVAQKGEMFAHGETAKAAAHDLRYKISDRDTTFCAKWTPESLHTLEDLIHAYRAITGACAEGTREWCEGKKLPSKISVKVAIRLTRGAYRAEQFAAFFDKAKL